METNTVMTAAPVAVVPATGIQWNHILTMVITFLAVVAPQMVPTALLPPQYKDLLSGIFSVASALYHLYVVPPSATVVAGPPPVVVPTK